MRGLLHAARVAAAETDASGRLKAPDTREIRVTSRRIQADVGEEELMDEEGTRVDE